MGAESQAPNDSAASSPKASVSLVALREAWPFAAVLTLAVVAAYWPVREAGFVWDDDAHVTANPCIVGPLGLKEIWTTPAANYFPLVLTNFWLQHALWGLHPLGYHIVTVCWHLLSALLLWRVLLLLGVPKAWLGAALWALHPVQVESVAWISELKNTQSGFFFLLAIWFWVTWQKSSARSARPYVLALIGATLALLSKPSTVMLPVALALCTWWQAGKLARRDLLGLAPFFALSAATSAWTIWEQRVHSGASGAVWNQTLIERCAIAGKTCWFYLGKLLWPHPLAFIYPRWEIAATLRDFLPTGAALGALAALWWWRDRWRAAFAGGSFFVAMLFPVLGFFSVYFFRYSFVGDHFQYLASMAPLVLIAAALGSLPPRIFAVAAAGLLLGCGVLTWQQAATYRDEETLYRATLARNPSASLMHNNLGVLIKERDMSAAIAHFNAALRTNPDYADAHLNLGLALETRGQHREALEHFAAAVRLGFGPELFNARLEFAGALRRAGRVAEAIEQYGKAVELEPANLAAHYNYANALLEAQRWPEAIEQYRVAIKLRPDFAEAFTNLGNALLQSGRAAEAVDAYREALRLKPDLAVARANLEIAQRTATERKP